MAKKLTYGRHSDKDGEIIGKDGIALAQKMAPSGDFTDGFHGILIRTCQTLLAAVSSIGICLKPHPPIEEIGDADTFKGMVNDKFKEAAGKGMTHLEALKAAHSEEKFREFAENAFNGVKKMFEMIEEGGHGLAYGHDPVVPLAVIGAGREDIARSLGSMEYYVFSQDNEGNITVAAG